MHLVGSLRSAVLASSFSSRGAGFKLPHALPHGYHFLPQLLLGSVSVSAHSLGLMQRTITLFRQQTHMVQSVVQLCLTLIHVRQQPGGALGSFS